MYSLLFLGFGGFILSLFLTPAVRKVSILLGVVDQPDRERKFHGRPIPRVGGIAIALAYTGAFGLLLVAKLKAGMIVWEALPLIWKVLPAASLVFVTGLLDDLIRLKPWQKLLGQITAAVIVYFAGIRVLAVGGEHLVMWWSFPATVVWLVACANAVNLIDGLDGLATGVALVATATTVVAASLQHNVDLALATVPLVGCLLGFLRYNFNPATVFLGDCGSLFIGFLLGCYGVLWSQKSATILGMTAPLIALSIPLIDTSLSIVRRFLRRQPIFTADRNHIHHRLLEHGLTPRRASLLLYGTGAIGAIFSLAMINNRLEVPIILVFCIAAWIGVRRLGYIEFDTAGRMLLEGSFRRLLNSNILLRNFESSLWTAKTPEECWKILRNTYKDFGFHRVDFQLAGSTYVEKATEPSASRAWRVEIPLSDCDYVHLTRHFDTDAKHNVVAPFADVLHRILQAKLPSFISPNPPASAARVRQTEPSVVISVYNGGLALRNCLASLARNREQFGEFLVVDDGSTDGATQYAEDFGARVLRIGSRQGPANGRNIGALAATGDVVLFLDADVCVHEDTIPKICRRFDEDSGLGAVFGSYDSEPDAPGFVSQFRNLLHCFVHQTSKRHASTFWAGCGAIRRRIFLENQGFDISYSVPCIEDIELGTRLVNKGVSIALDPSILVKHLKRWTLGGMLVTDMRLRGIPWTRHILSSHEMPDDLNLRLGSRISVALTSVLCLCAGLFGISFLTGGANALLWRQALLLLVVLGSIVAINLPFYRFLAARRNERFAVASVPLHLLYFFVCGTSFVLGVAIYTASQMARRLSRTQLAPGRPVEHQP